MDGYGQLPSLSEIGEKKYVYIVVNVDTRYYMYAVYRLETRVFNSFTRFNPSMPWLDEPFLLLGREFPAGMGFFSFRSKIYMLCSSEGEIEDRSRSVHVFDTVTCDLVSAAYDQQMRTEKYQPVVIQPLKPFDDRVFVFSGDGCGEDLEVFYPEFPKDSWELIGGSSYTFPSSCRCECHSTVSEGFVLLTTNNVVLFYNILSSTWTVVEDQSYTTCLLLEPCVFAYEIDKWFYFRDHYLCSYLVDRENGMHEFGKSPYLYLPQGPTIPFQNIDHLIYLGNLCFCVVRSGYDRPAGWRDSPDDPVAKHHATVTMLRIDSSAKSILEERTTPYRIMPLDPYEHTDSAYVCACFVI